MSKKTRGPKLQLDLPYREVEARLWPILPMRLLKWKYLRSLRRKIAHMPT